MYRFPVLIAALGAAFVLSGCPTMGKFNALKDRVAGQEETDKKHEEALATLEARLENLNQLYQKDDEAIRAQVADLAADFAELQMAVGALQGRNEEISFKLAEVGKHVKGLKGLVEDRFGTDSDALPSDLPADPAGFFEVGMNAAKSGMTRKARAVFKEFIKRYPDNEKADDAEFMIGETLFAEGRFTESITSYKTVYDNYQTGDRYRDAVLRIGLAYVRSNNCKKALQIYRFAVKTFKGTPEAETAAKEAKEIEKVCK